jgi:dihydroneopterin aldolase
LCSLSNSTTPHAPTKLKDTVSYDTLVKIASEVFCARRYRLVEAAAGAVADAVLELARRSAVSASLFTSRMHRSRQPSTTSA